MPRIETWDNLPVAVRRHLIERMRERSINISDLNQLRLWIDSKPEVPDGQWYKDFSSFKICGQGRTPKHSYFGAKRQKAPHFRGCRGVGPRLSKCAN